MKVVQKDGVEEVFDWRRVYTSLKEETGCENEVAEEATRYITNHLLSYKLPHVTGPLIRELACIALMELGRDDLRRKYTRVGMPVFDATNLDAGGGKGDNANLQCSPETVHKRKADRVSKEQYYLSLPEHLAQAHLSGDIHIHDLEYFGTRQFCLDSDLRYFFKYGFVGDGTGEHTSIAGPAKRAEVAILHAAKVLGASQTQCAGGQGFYNFLTFLAPFFENRDYRDYYQCMQMFCYEMTQMLVARGGQAVFSSVQLSPGVPKLWQNIPIVYKGKVWDGKEAPLRTYGEFEAENRLLFKAMMEVMLEGDHTGKPFYFPKPEINIAPEFLALLDQKVADLPSYRDLYMLAFELASKFGTPYFDNTIPKYRQTGGLECFQCCAYNFKSNADNDSDFDDKLYFRNGAHFSMGAWQVMTLNLPRIAAKVDADTVDGRMSAFLYKSKKVLDLCVDVFKEKRSLMDANVKRGSVPFLSQQRQDEKGNVAPPLVDFDKLVWTVGICGLNEVVKHITGSWLHEDKQAQRIGLRICLELKKYCEHLSEKHGMPIVLSRTPAETTAQRFATMDLLNWIEEGNDPAEFVCQGDLSRVIEEQLYKKTRDLPIYYTNGTHVSPAAQIPITDRVRIEQAFFPVLDGGNICHIWMGEAHPSPSGLMDLTLKACQNTNLGYFAFTRDMTTRTTIWRRYSP